MPFEAHDWSIKYLVSCTNDDRTKEFDRYILIDLSIWLFHIFSVVYKRFHVFRCTENFSIEKNLQSYWVSSSIPNTVELPLLCSLNIYLKQPRCIVCHVWLNLVKWFWRKRWKMWQGLRRQRKQRQRRTSSEKLGISTPMSYNVGTI